MRRLPLLAAGLLCCFHQGANAQSFELQALQAAERASGMTQHLRQVLTANTSPGCGVDCEPIDLFDESKGGIAAKFITIKGGEFVMGSPEDEEWRSVTESQFEVTLTKDFEMQATEVTQLQYFAVTNHNPSVFKNERDCDKDSFKVKSKTRLCADHPVENVSWEDARKFIERLNSLQSKHHYRLPTEAEWEFAARGGAPSRFPYWFGCTHMDVPGEYGWYEDNSSDRTHAVATKKANQYGLHDMNGNVFEWTQDWWDFYPDGAVTDPAGPAKGSERIMRGGAWNYPVATLRSASRARGEPSSRGAHSGFRLVRSRR